MTEKEVTGRERARRWLAAKAANQFVIDRPIGSGHQGGQIPRRGADKVDRRPYGAMGTSRYRAHRIATETLVTRQPDIATWNSLWGSESGEAAKAWRESKLAGTPVFINGRRVK